jgi:hypothetical protein
MGERRNLNTILVGKSERKRLPGRLYSVNIQHWLGIDKLPSALHG